MENLIEELTKVNPSNLSEEGLKLFNKINEIIDKNQELEEEDKELLEVKISASAHNRILELEKENNQLKLEIADLYKSRGEYEKTKSIMTNELRDYIPKSLIKEKKEILKEKK